jgi:hypothetical protein
MTTIKIMKLTSILSAVILLCAGCAGGGPLLQPVVTQQPIATMKLVLETNMVTVTNLVTQTLTNGVTVTNHVVQTEYQVQQVPVLVTNLVNVTNAYVVSSTASNVLSYAGMANSFTAPVDPYSGLITLALGLATAGLGWFAKIKSKQAATNLSTAATVITAVEGLEPAAAAAVKAAVTAKSNQMNTTAAVSAVVTAVTQNL